MPATTGLSTASTRLVNNAFAMTFFNSVMRNVWPHICDTTESHSSYEPFAFNGASPMLKLFHGSMQSQTIQSYSLNVPNAQITIDPAATQATTSFDTGRNTWKTTVPKGLSGNTFLDGLGFQVPVKIAGGTNPVAWNATFTTDTPGISFNWQWAAAVYTSFSADDNALGVKPVDDNKASVYKNSDHAGTPENFKAFVVGGARGGGGSNFTGSYSGTGNGRCS
jgi:hypothetical protein